MAVVDIEDNSENKSYLVKHAIQIISSMVLGVVIGLIVHKLGNRYSQPCIDFGNLIVNLFLRLIKMIVAPLVFATLVSGIGNIQDTKTIKKVGIRVMIWFIGISLAALSLGLVAANIIKPGRHFTNTLPTSKLNLQTFHFDIQEFILNIVPDSIIKAMAENNILQIVVFSIFAGIAIAALPERSCRQVHEITEGLAKIMLKITDMVMKVVPLVVFASLLSISAKNGSNVISSYGMFLLEFYFVIIILCLLLILAGYLAIGKKIFKLLSFIIEPVLLGYATASSESAFPRLLERLEKFGVSPRIAGFVLPLGYSFNLAGTMMFISFCAIFIAQVYEIQMPIEKQITMLLVMMISSKGIAGVPRASMVMLASVMPQFGIPEAGLALIFGIDQFLDMARTATSVLGNGIVTAIADEWDDSEPEATSEPVTFE
ncbi:MAG: dicarboxylate/amino acid:cation symporter [Commensalibacter sp.]